MDRTASRADRIELLDFRSVPMRAFHVTWVAFFVAFFAWFAIAPLLPYVREELHLTQRQIALANVAGVSATILARLVVGRLCDLFGPRRTYAGLLAVAALPVMSVACVESYGGFLVARLGIGIVGASFVLTQYHTSSMFSSSVVGTANAAAAGWGNLGGGVTQMAMPLVLAGVMAFGVEHGAWRYAMIVPGVLLLFASVAYLRLTQDTPAGNYPEARPAAAARGGGFLRALRDPRVLLLALAYGACFGVELTVNGNAALYFHDRFGLTAGEAAFLAGLHGAMNLFARALGGLVGDRFGRSAGVRGRVLFLAGILVAEGIALVAFGAAETLGPAIAWLVAFSLFVEMGCGATYSVVPFIHRRALGSVSGIVGAGGNVGAVLFGALLGAGHTLGEVFEVMGASALLAGALTTWVRPNAEDDAQDVPEARDHASFRAELASTGTAAG